MIYPVKTKTPKKRSGWRAITLLAVLVFLALTFQESLLTGLANAYIVNEAPTKSDAIIVLGGGIENRPFAAAKLYHQGLAPKILYMDVKLSPTAELGITQTEKDMTRRVLLSNNVPETAIEAIGKAVASTYDESQAVRSWIQTNHAKSILIPTDLFHTRRVRWLFNKQLKDTGTQIHVTVAPTRHYQSTNWWKNEQGLIAFQNELIKLPYYWVNY